MSSTHTTCDPVETATFSDVERIESPMIGYPTILTPGSVLAISLRAPQGLASNGQAWNVSISRGIRRISTGKSTTIDDGTYYFEAISLKVVDIEYCSDFRYQVSALIPEDVQVDLYDLSVETAGRSYVQENAVQIVSSFTSEPTFCIVSDPHVGFRGYPCIDEPDVDEIRLFVDVIQHVNESRPDFVVVTGDLVDWSSQTNWKNFRNLLKKFQVPVFTVTGNHDYYWDNWWEGYPPLLPPSVRCDPVALRYYLRHINPKCRYSFDFGPIHAACIDSGDDAVLAAVEAYGSGLTDEDLAWLQADLDGREGSIVLMHHPATRAGAEDELKRRANAGCITRNRLEFMELCARNKVRAVFSGHEHKHEHWSQDGVDYYTSPSVCRSHEDNGFRTVRFSADGGFRTDLLSLVVAEQEQRSL